MNANSMRHGLRLLAILALLGAAAFPIYWMFVTSLTTSKDLFAAAPTCCPASRNCTSTRTSSRSSRWRTGS